MDADEVAKIEARSEKQLETLYKAVEPLSKLGFLKFIACIKRQAFAYEWAKHLYDVTENELTATQMTRLIENRHADAARCKAYVDMRNAYMIIIKKCEGHTVQHILSSVKIGDARACLNKLYSYFYPKTPSGIQACYTKFNADTQGNTNTTLVEWIDVVESNAAILRYVSGAAAADDTAARVRAH